VIFKFFPGLYMGWGLGSNDAANVFGPQTHSGIISYRWASWLTAIFILLGALFEGDKCFAQIGGLTSATGLNEVILAILAASIMIHFMSYLKLPASTSHAIVGSLIGVGIAYGREVNVGRLWASVICWIVTPIGTALLSYIIFQVVGVYFSRKIKNVLFFNSIIKISSILIGCYGAYSLGANNLANVVGPYVGIGALSSFSGRLIGGIAIAIGVLTYSKNVMETVGKGITALDPVSALVTILSAAIVLHIFAQIGIPVSSSQAVVGAVLGVGLVKGAKTVSYKKLIQIFIGWICTLGGTIIFAGILSYLYKAIF
jgi:PiT family inorganic phosphate transporter